MWNLQGTSLGLTVCLLLVSSVRPQHDNSDSLLLPDLYFNDDYANSGIYEDLFDDENGTETTTINVTMETKQQSCESISTNSTSRTQSINGIGICDSNIECDYCVDETNCSGHDDFPTVFTCEKTCVLLGGSCPAGEGCVRFCDGYQQCPDGTDEPFDTFGFKCPVNPIFQKTELRKKRCTIPNEYIARWKNPGTREIYKKHSICPNTEDVCYTENNNFLNISKCFQCLDGTIISISQFCDQKFDCRDLSDECLCNTDNSTLREICQNQKQKDCGSNIVVNDKNNMFSCQSPEDFCQNNSDCPTQENQTEFMKCFNTRDGFEIRAKRCDGRPECPGLEDECNPECTPVPEFCKLLSRMFADTLHGCDVITQSEQIGNVDHHSFICNHVQDCKNNMDEMYCPYLESCGEERNTSFDTDEKCDYIMDCKESGEDERNCSDCKESGGNERSCSDRFYCNDQAPPGLPETRVNDGKIDCADGEDECEFKKNSFSSGQNMIKHKLILISMWIMAVVALIGNSVVIYNCAKDLRDTYVRKNVVTAQGRVGVCNKTLVLNLALADFLMGLYLLILSIKAAQYNGTYCKYWQEWRTSTLCSGLGSLAVLSSQTSVLIMVMMTSYRFYSIRKPFRVEVLRPRYLVAVVMACWIPPAILAFSPLHGNNQAFAFISKTKMPFFESAVLEKTVFEQFVRKAWTSSNSSSQEFGANGWPDLFDKFCRLYPEICSVEDTSGVVEKWLGYFSADSVCLPRLFPHHGDSGWEYTAGVIAFDFIAFIYILLIYILMYICTVRMYREPGTTSNGRGSSVSSIDARSKEDRVIWQRISRLLFTDFLCWMPICITCIISLGGKDIPPLMYQISAAFFLPINSALNPLLYSDAIYRLSERMWDKCKRYLNCRYLMRCNTAQAPTVNSKMRMSGSCATDDLRASRDQLAPVTANSLVSETDRNPDYYPMAEYSNRLTESDHNKNSIALPVSSRPEIRVSLTRSMAKMSRCFSSGKDTLSPVLEPPHIRRHRPKSQSTTSTSTTLTIIGHDHITG